MEHDLGRRYAEMPEGTPKEAALLELCQCFHGYLMKYLVMICRGHVPMWGKRINRDVEPFIKYFLPRGAPANQSTVGIAVRHFHLAFKGMRTEEIYGVLMEQLIRAIHKYDPAYTDKVKLVVEEIENEIPPRKQFSVAELNRHLEFDCSRYVRLLCRRGFLAPVSEKRKRITEFTRSDEWPPPASFFESGAIGITYYLQTWFRYYLQQWIDESMSLIESKEGVSSLPGRLSAADHAAGREDLSRADRRRRGRVRARVRHELSAALHRAPERLKVVGGGLREFVKRCQQLLGARKIHPQAARLQANPLGQFGQLPAEHIRLDG